MLPFPLALPQEHDPGSGYLYNSALRYYHDTKSGWYFGGDPPCWTQNPPIPEVARYERFYQAPEEEQGGAGPLPQGRPGLSTTVRLLHPLPRPSAPLAHVSSQNDP